MAVAPDSIMPTKAQDASGLAGLQEALEVLGFPELPADPTAVDQVPESGSAS